MKRWTLALLLALPLAAQADDVTWQPTDPAPHHYQLRVRTATETWVEITEQPSLVGVVLPVEPHWIDVRACESSGWCEGWSDYTPHTADCDDNGMVGLSDYTCMESWLEWLTHYGDATVWDERLGLRRYGEDSP